MVKPPRAFFFRLKALGAPRVWLAPIAAVKYLQAAVTLGGSYDLGVAITKLDLTHRAGMRRRACGKR
jgi:hypothetical protein